MLLDNHCVTAIVPGDRVTVRTDKGDYSSRKVVITAGAWASQLLSNLGLQLHIKVRVLGKVNKPVEYIQQGKVNKPVEYIQQGKVNKPVEYIQQVYSLSLNNRFNHFP